ncbi:MAG: hydrolase [Lachnospiraceae bacterium]|nr:hydrolase [Lachnospiraceae bacterium]
MANETYPCPCCGYRTLEGRGEYEICPVCFWEDDPLQSADPHLAGGANEPDLLSARENYRCFGACEERFRDHVRDPYPEEMT